MCFKASNRPQSAYTILNLREEKKKQNPNNFMKSSCKKENQIKKTEIRDAAVAVKLQCKILPGDTVFLIC